MKEINWKKRSAYHWQIMLNGKGLDYWPSKRKWRHRQQTMTQQSTGMTVEEYVAGECNPREWPAEECAAQEDSHWGYVRIDETVRVYIAHPNMTKSEASKEVLRALQMARTSYQVSA